MTHYPSYDAVVQLHGHLLALFGGARGIRDSAAIESALARPQVGYYRDLIEEAAALTESLSQNHPFVDGNKRTSIAVGISLLERNGYRVNFRDREAYDFFIQLYQTRRFKLTNLDLWLKERTEAAR